MKTCRYCKSEIDDKAKVCPHCRKNQSGFSAFLKMIIVIIAVVIFLPLIVGACKSMKKGYNEAKESSEKKVEVVTEATEPENNTTEPTQPIEKITEEIEQKDLYDKDGIVITLIGIENSNSSLIPHVNLRILVENNSSQNICVQTRDFSVNGFMVDTSFSPEVAPNKKINDEIIIYQDELDKNGITFDSIENIEFYFHIFDRDNWQSSIDSDMITIDIS